MRSSSSPEVREIPISPLILLQHFAPVEMEADVMLKGTRVDGVYTSDPEKDPEAEKYEELTFNEALQKELRILDLTAFTMCKENDLPIIVFNMNKKGNLKRLISGEKVGTLVKI